MTTASERGRANRRAGIRAEQLVARYLRAAGFPDAVRAERNGWRTAGYVSPDPGDITGIPGIVWSVKNVQRVTVPTWLTDVEAVRDNHGADLAVLVVRRRGTADVARWWAWVSLPALVRAVLGTGWHDVTGHVCIELGELAPMLHRAGYGSEVTA